MTIEAALILPMAVFFCLAFMEPVWWLDRQRQVQTEIETFNEKLCSYAYMEDYGEETDDREPETVYGRFLSDAAAGLWIKGKAEEIVPHAAVKRSDILDGNGDILLELNYREPIPFFPQVSSGILMNASSRRRAWIGLDGKLKMHDMQETESDSPGEKMVYVGANMGRYHLYRDCHYISNEYTEVSESQAALMKNSYGVRLMPCMACKRDGKPGETVYITKEGEHYHYSKNCSSMVSYVRCVPLKEVEYLGACSVCSGRSAVGG